MAISTVDLAALPLLQLLPPERLRQLQPRLELRRLRLGQVLQTVEQPGQGVALLRKGQLRCLAAEPLQSGLRTIARVEPGGVAGLFGALSGLSESS